MRRFYHSVWYKCFTFWVTTSLPLRTVWLDVYVVSVIFEVILIFLSTKKKKKLSICSTNFKCTYRGPRSGWGHGSVGESGIQGPVVVQSPDWFRFVRGRRDLKSGRGYLGRKSGWGRSLTVVTSGPRSGRWSLCKRFVWTMDRSRVPGSEVWWPRLWECEVFLIPSSDEVVWNSGPDRSPGVTVQSGVPCSKV